jgi:hypothetical protein
MEHHLADASLHGHRLPESRDTGSRGAALLTAGLALAQTALEAGNWVPARRSSSKGSTWIISLAHSLQGNMVT